MPYVHGLVPGLSSGGRSGRLLRIVVGVVMMAFVAAVAFQCARIGLSGLIVELAQTELERRYPPGRKVPRSELDRIVGIYSDSLGFHAANPWALEALAQLDLGRMRATRMPEEAKAFARGAYRRLREALRERPTSPYLWANLALAKLFLDEIDDEFRAAVGNADRLGPWEPTTQELVLFASLAAWDSLDEPLHRAAQGVLERGATRNALKMLNIARRFRRLDLVCPLKGYYSVAGQDCATPAKR